MKRHCGADGGRPPVERFLTLELIPVVYTYWRYAQLKPRIDRQSGA